MLRRYQRALRCTAPKTAARPSGMVLDGYWIAEGLFYFLAERFEPTLGHIIGVPTIAEVATQTTREVISLDLLCSLLGQPLDLEALSWARFDMPDANTLAVTVVGKHFLIDVQQQRILETRPSLSFAALYSPDGRHACFVRGNDLWIVDRTSGVERRLTTDGAPHFRYARESEAGLAAIPDRSSPTPIGLWSPDSQWFLTHVIDDRALPDFVVTQHAPPDAARPIFHQVKVSTPQDPLPTATFVAFHIDSGRVLRFDDVPTPVPNYSPFLFRMVWFDRGDRAWFVRRDRYCRRVELVCLDLTREESRVVLTEIAPTGYVDVHPIMVATPNIRVLTQSDEVVWFSERDGWGHLYLYDANTGALKNRITTGQWLVRDIVHVDEAKRKVLFLAGGLRPDIDPARRALGQVSLDGGGFEMLLESEDEDLFVALSEPCGLQQDAPWRPVGLSPGISPTGRTAVVRRSNTMKGNFTQIVDLDREQSFTIAYASPESDEPNARRFEALAADGVTLLHGVMFVPTDFDAQGRYPLIDYIYPGPQVAQQPQAFRSMNAALAVALAELGFVTIMLDSRGLPIGSRAFHQAGYPALNQPQLADHASVVQQLAQRYSFIDGGRMGMVGYSAGGGATLRALCEYADVFRVGVAVCPYADGNACPAVWVDKYRGPEPIARTVEAPNQARANELTGKLLLVAGDLDENVPMAQTLVIANALIRANRDFELLIVPNAAHELLLTHGYAQRRVWDFFVRHLRDEQPPPNFEIRFEPAEQALFARRWMWEYRQ